jgi:hypothetical protein
MPQAVLNARALKCTIVLDPVEVAQVVATDGKPRTVIAIRLPDRRVSADLNAKSVRKAVATISERARRRGGDHPRQAGRRRHRRGGDRRAAQGEATARGGGRVMLQPVDEPPQRMSETGQRAQPKHAAREPVTAPCHTRRTATLQRSSGKPLISLEPRKKILSELFTT